MAFSFWNTTQRQDMRSGPAHQSVEVFRVQWRNHPRMLPRFVDRDPRSWEVRIRESTHWYRRLAWHCFGFIANGGTTRRTKMECDATATVGYTLVFRRVAAHSHIVSGKPSLSSEHTARSFLAVQAMAHRNSNRIAIHRGSELSAAAGCEARAHRFHPFISSVLSIMHV
jgi:hypothetical protein